MRRLEMAFWDDDVASDADWDKYIHKGGALMCGLVGSDRTAGRLIKDTRNPPLAASVWSGNLKQELYDWYWREMNPSSKGCQLGGWEFSGMLNALGLSEKEKAKGGNNQCSRIEHWDANKEDDKGHQVPAINQWYKVGDTDYRVSLKLDIMQHVVLTLRKATKAHYEFIVDTKGGGRFIAHVLAHSDPTLILLTTPSAIYCMFLDSPKSSASREWYGNKKDPDNALLPHLKLLSDVLWGYWVRDNPNVKNIRYFFMLGISNDLTNQLIASCLQKAKKQLSEWPGVSFDISTDEGHALLYVSSTKRT